MAIQYQEWLRRTGRRGTAADAMVWKKTHGVALGLYNPDGTRAAVTVAAPTTATEAVPDPQVSDPRLIPFTAQLQAIPGRYNDERRTQANLTLKRLIDEGLIEGGSLEGVESDSGIVGGQGEPLKNILYRIVRGADGRAYMQAFLDIRSAQASRGFLESSQTQRRISDARRDLNLSVENALLGLGRQQQSSLAQQRGDITGIGKEIGGVRADIAREQAAQPAAPAAPAAPPAAPTVKPLPATLQTPAAFAKWLSAAGRPLTGTAFQQAYWKARQAHGSPVPGAKIM
jgi:hypothetical protein